MNENTAQLRDILEGVLRAHAGQPDKGQVVNPAVCAVVTVEEDRQYLTDTLTALLGQSVLPAVLIIADCSATAAGSAQYTVPVPGSPIAGSAAVSGQRVEVRSVAVQRAASFGDAVNQAVNQGGLRSVTTHLWLFHDDSRPVGDKALERLLEADRNSPGAKLIGAKQVEWESGNLQNVGYFITRDNRRASLVVDGEEDQDQYDGRQDVYGVSLAGALVWLPTWVNLTGTDPWYGTFGESIDLARRVYLSGGRVVVVPEVVIAHRRARLAGLRSREGQARTGLPPRSSYNDVLIAADKFVSTQTPLLKKPFGWLWRVLVSLVLCVSCLFAKKPYEAVCELVAPWRALLRLPQSVAARGRLRTLPRADRSRIGSLIASAALLRDWRQRRKILAAQQATDQVLSPLEIGYLRSLARKRLAWLTGLVLIGLAAGLGMSWSLLGGILSGGSLYSPLLAPTAATLPLLARTATSMWSYASGLGGPAAPLPFSLALMVLSLLTGGHLAPSIGLLYLLAPAAMMAAFWALAGVATRSNPLRFAAALVWGLLPGGLLGVYQNADLPMLLVLIGLPLSFCLIFRALGMYAVDRPRRPHSSIQSAALAGLLMTFVSVAEPQLVLPLFLTFAAFLIVAKAHRAMLLLIPVPSIAVLLPTFFSVLIHAKDGLWRQLFADAMIPSQAFAGSPSADGPAARLWSLVQTALGTGQTGSGSAIGGPLAVAGWQQVVAVVLLAGLGVVLLAALASLTLPSGLRLSRMAWVLIACGALLAALAPRVAIGLDAGSAVAASVLPATAYLFLGVLLAACCVTGRQDKPFSVRSGRSRSDGPRSGAMPAGGGASGLAAVAPQASGLTVMTRSTGSAAKLAGPGHGPGRSKAAAGGSFVRVCLSVILCLIAGLTLALAGPQWPAASRLALMPGSGLPLIAVDDLQASPGARVFGLSAVGPGQVEFSVMRTPLGDLADRNATSQVTGLFVSDPVDARLRQVAAQLLSSNDAAAVAQLSKLGFAGIYVPPSTSSARASLVAHVIASDGTQEVVNNSSGLYVRLATERGGVGRIDTRGQQQALTDPLRLVWLVILGVIVLAYLIVSIPRRKSGQSVEVEK